MIKHAVAALAVTMAVAAVPAVAAPPDGKGADRARIYVAYKAGQRGPAQRALAAVGAEVHYDFPGLNGYAVSLPSVAVQALLRNPAIEYVEEDPKRYLMAETTPYGIGMVEADQVFDTDATGVVVCIIDSGVNLGHEDLGGNEQFSGQDDPQGSGAWDGDENGHGTHVAGTIAALANNNQGVVGVNPSGRLPIRIVKVFGASGWTYSSSLVDALAECESGAAGNKLVVNMSLGGSFKSRFEDSAFAAAYGRGVLSIAAAGNDGNTRKSYPASYDSVVSVAAVDANLQVASFSQQNDQVELSGPGVHVLSTVPMQTGTSSSATVASTPYSADALDGSVFATATGTLVDCGLAGTTCGAALGGKICLIERGDFSFLEKVLNCQDGGGAGAIIYNNVDGPLLGTFGDTGPYPGIPAVGVSRTDGLTMSAGATATVSVARSNYAYFDGTSMATPHVAGVAALVWGQSNASGCTNAQIRAALNASALDLPVGANDGRDLAYGYGLVQAKAATDYLGANSCGSTGGSGGSGGGGGKPDKGGGGGGGKGKPK